MGSIGINTRTVDAFNGYFGERDTKSNSLSRLEALNDYNIVNPKYIEGGLYKTNCALCATAVVLQALGYDVEAMPKDKDKWRGFDSVFEVDYRNTDNYMLSGSRYGMLGVMSKSDVQDYFDVENPPRAARGADAVARQIEEKAKGWGNGAVGVLNVKWKKTSGAHAINIFNKNGQVMGYDAQSNKIINNLPEYMKRTIANHTTLVRLDNAQIKSNIKQETLEKMFKKSTRKKDQVTMMDAKLAKLFS